MSHTAQATSQECNLYCRLPFFGIILLVLPNSGIWYYSSPFLQFFDNYKECKKETWCPNLYKDLV